ncbi:MAG: AAA family ATPase [Limnohabitans sp.]|jgi:adenylate kinase family enzyme|uniref:nucleoside monophosphate kinase n=1 Tax=Limnohabitans sp. TaxID=1907725 RepID=UPI0025DB3D28|nr:nucleoside monophosphate kinase [Limnohabitans sp.]MCO4087455.1 AAA family ATPase [Limnohabitans sp.]
MASKHPVLFFIGPHGSGKTTAGRSLEAHHGFKHMSLGDLGRLARQRKTAGDFSLRLMCLLVAQKPNQPLGHHLVDALLRSIHDMRQRQPISVDGFPAEPDHLKLLPAGSTVINFDVPDDVREARLTNRSEHGPRKWVQGGQSLRDASLPALLSEGAGEIQTIDAKVDPQAVIRQLLAFV